MLFIYLSLPLLYISISIKQHDRRTTYIHALKTYLLMEVQLSALKSQKRALMSLLFDFFFQTVYKCELKRRLNPPPPQRPSVPFLYVSFLIVTSVTRVTKSFSWWAHAHWHLYSSNAHSSVAWKTRAPSLRRRKQVESTCRTDVPLGKWQVGHCFPIGHVKWQAALTHNEFPLDFLEVSPSVLVPRI